MNREQMVEKAAMAVKEANRQSYVGHYGTAEVVLDAVLPQVTTLADLEALSDKALLLDLSDGQTYRPDMARPYWMVQDGFSLIVVWTPEASE